MITHKAIPLNGAGLNFKVVGGTTEPTNPKENTIWVNTTTAISKWSLDKREPTSPIDGQIWIQIGNVDGDISFNALKKNKIDVQVYAVYQLIDSEWMPKIAYIYTDNEFIKFSDVIIRYTLSAVNKYNHQGGHFEFDENGDPIRFIRDNPEDIFSTPTTESVSIPIGTRFSIDKIYFLYACTYAVVNVKVYVNEEKVFDETFGDHYGGYSSIVSSTKTQYISTTATDTIKIELCGHTEASNSGGHTGTLMVDYSTYVEM